MLAATLCMATYFLLQKSTLAKCPSFDFAASSTWIATLSTALFAHDLARDFAASAQTSIILVVVVMGIFSSDLGFVFWFKVIALSTSNRFASFLDLQPVLVGSRVLRAGLLGWPHRLICPLLYDPKVSGKMTNQIWI